MERDDVYATVLQTSATRVNESCEETNVGYGPLSYEGIHHSLATVVFRPIWIALTETSKSHYVQLY